MNHYIQSYREAGYTGPIQVMKVRCGSDVRFFDPSHPLADVQEPGIDPKRCGLTRVRHYFDREQGLDVTELVLGDRPAGPVEIIDDYADDVPGGYVPYWRSLREHIGCGRVFTPGMSVIIRNGEGQFALLRRSDDGLWSFPAGAKEPGDTMEETCRKEVMEEAGIEIENPELIGLFSGSDLKRVYPNGHKMHFVSFLFRADYRSGTLRVNDSENTDVKWASREEVCNLDDWWLRRFRMYEAYRGEALCR